MTDIEPSKEHPDDQVIRVTIERDKDGRQYQERFMVRHDPWGLEKDTISKVVDLLVPRLFDILRK